MRGRLASPRSACWPCVHCRRNHCRARQRGWPHHRCGYYEPREDARC